MGDMRQREIAELMSDVLVVIDYVPYMSKCGNG
jgi:hypothetical protein